MLGFGVVGTDLTECWSLKSTQTQTLLSRDFGSNRSRASAKMLIYSHLAKPLEILSLHTCLRCQSSLMHHLEDRGLGLN